MVSVSPCRPIGCQISPPSISSQNIQSHKTNPTRHKTRGDTKSMTYALGVNDEGKDRVKLDIVGYKVAK